MQLLWLWVLTYYRLLLDHVGRGSCIIPPRERRHRLQFLSHTLVLTRNVGFNSLLIG